MRGDEAVEGARARGEPRGHHVIDGIGHASGVGGPRALRQLLQEGQAQALLHRPSGRRPVPAGAPALGRTAPPRAAPLGDRRCPHGASGGAVEARGGGKGKGGGRGRRGGGGGGGGHRGRGLAEWRSEGFWIVDKDRWWFCQSLGGRLGDGTMAETESRASCR